MWIRDWDKIAFDSEDEAFGDACMEMLTDGATGDYLQSYVTYDKLLNWAMTQDGFFDVFKDELYKAQQDYFNDSYFEMEDNEDDGKINFCKDV